MKIPELELSSPIKDEIHLIMCIAIGWHGVVDSPTSNKSTVTRLTTWARVKGNAT